MGSEVTDMVTGWDSASIERGYGGLRLPADDGLIGVVVIDMTWRFMLNGRLLGTFDETVVDLKGGSFEVHRAPDPALPPLYTMQETGGDIRVQYYMEETPLQDTNGTLSSSGFTGYVGLSENVLPDDYFVVHHGGKSMSATFVGSSKWLITDDGAFERVSDEIDIYKVYDVDINLVDIPEVDPNEGVDNATGATAGGVAPAGDETDAIDPSEKPGPEPVVPDESGATTAVDETAPEPAGGDDNDNGGSDDGGSVDSKLAMVDAPTGGEPGPVAAATDVITDDVEPTASTGPDDELTETGSGSSMTPDESRSPESTEAAASTTNRSVSEKSRPLTDEGPVVTDAPQKNNEATSPDPDPDPEGGTASDDVFSAEA